MSPIVAVMTRVQNRTCGTSFLDEPYAGPYAAKRMCAS
jgi:hypothetical protein